MKTYKIYYGKNGIGGNTIKLIATDLFELVKLINRTMERPDVENIYKIFII